MRDLCPASVSALHSDRNRASANASAAVSSQTRHVLRRLWLIVVNRELAPGDGTNPLLLPVDSLLYFRSLPPISGISRDDAESEIESWRIELRLARNQRQLFALASLSRLIARHTRSRLAPWPQPRFDALECHLYCHHKLRKNPGF